MPKDSQNFYKHPPEFPYDLNQSNQLYRFNGPNRIDSHSLQIQTNFPHLYNEDHEKSDFEINKKRKPNKRKNKEKIKKKSELISKRKSSDSESDSSGSISDSSIQSNASKAKLKRGKYHYYTLETKLKAIKLMEEGVDLKEVSKALAVPPKNLKRWYKVGPYRKKGYFLYFR